MTSRDGQVGQSRRVEISVNCILQSKKVYTQRTHTNKDRMVIFNNNPSLDLKGFHGQISTVKLK